MSEQDPTDLVGATNRLTEKVNELAAQISLSKANQATLAANQTALSAANHKQRNLTRFVSLLLVLTIGALGYTYTLASDLKQNAVAGCKNSNESRLGAERLWVGIIDAPKPDGTPERPPEVQKQVDDLRSFVNKLYQQRDCDHLGKKYPLPELPDSLKPRGQ